MPYHSLDLAVGYLQIKKTHGKADARALTGPEIAARELNAREREQRLQGREEIAIGLSLRPETLILTATEMTQFGPRDVAIVTGQQDEEFVIRAMPPPAEAIPIAQEKDPLVLSASTAPALWQTN